MARRPIWLGLLDVVALVACVLATASFAANAVTADHWPVRAGLAAIAIALAVLVVRGAQTVLEDWRS
jgi:hypothetical protein